MSRPLHVYVIRLSDRIWHMPRFAAYRKQFIAPVYVGSSAHTPACRFQLHRGEGRCTCGLKKGPVREVHSHWVLLYGEKVIEAFPAATVAEARAAEKRLALRLQRDGYAVWTG